MGLDITAYSNLKKVDIVFNQDGEPIDPVTRKIFEGDYFQPRGNGYFDDRADGIDFTSVYLYDKFIGFRAGSYGYYNRWREELAKLSGWPLSSYEEYGKMWPSYAASTWDANSGPFCELIHFSDCEGAIGAITSAKLARDFEKFQEAANAHEDECFSKKYREWRAAFELAANNGAVSFH